MFCLLYTLLDWPGIHTCVITCYIVSLGSAGETVQKLRLRLAGCVIGALAGTAASVFIVPHMDSIASLLALVSIAAAVGLDRGGPAGHRLRGLPDRLRLLPVRHPGRRPAST